MPFVLLPVLDRMIELYRQPRDMARFKAYLAALTTENGKDLDLPIGAYNPMAREHVLDYLLSMKRLDAEARLQVEIDAMNASAAVSSATTRVAIGLADDLGGSWTNRYSTDYQNKFRNQALVKRHFCTPVFWVSEPFDLTLLASRSREFMHRFVYQQTHGKPVTLAEHVRQEGYVQRLCDVVSVASPGHLSTARALFEAHWQTDDSSLIFAFFYGDSAAQSFGYQPIGAPDKLGFITASTLSTYPLSAT